MIALAGQVAGFPAEQQRTLSRRCPVDPEEKASTSWNSAQRPQYRLGRRQLFSTNSIVTELQYISKFGAGDAMFRAVSAFRPSAALCRRSSFFQHELRKKSRAAHVLFDP